MKHLSTLFAALVLWSAAGPQGVVAQDQRGDRPAVDQKTTESRHEILPYIRGGVSTLHYKADNGSRTSGFGGRRRYKLCLVLPTPLGLADRYRMAVL